MTDPLRTLVTLNTLVRSFRSACTELSNFFVSSFVHSDNDLSAMRNTNASVFVVGLGAEVVGGEGVGLLHAVDDHIHVDDAAHCPSSDPEDMPLLQVPSEGHQPQAEAEEHVVHESYELHASGAKAVQSKAER